jgi:hypothetical protein
VAPGIDARSSCLDGVRRMMTPPGEKLNAGTDPGDMRPISRPAFGIGRLTPRGGACGAKRRWTEVAPESMTQLEPVPGRGAIGARCLLALGGRPAAARTTKRGGV